MFDFLDQEWDLTESDESVRRVTERFVDTARTAAKGYAAFDAAAENRRQLKRKVSRANLHEAVAVIGLVGTVAKFISGGRR